MAHRKTDEELLAELRLFNHHDAAKRLEQLLEANRLRAAVERNRDKIAELE